MEKRQKIEFNLERSGLKPYFAHIVSGEDFRRGKPSCHRQFGEAIAILAGDALLTLAFEVHPDDVLRLGRMLKGAQQTFHPLHDFIRSLLEAFLVTPTDIILDDVPGKGLQAFVNVQRTGTMLGIPCYAPDVLALAGYMKIPIYAAEGALVHAAPRSSSAWAASGCPESSRWRSDRP